MNLLSKDEIIEVFTRFQLHNPNPKSELEWTTPFTLLVAVVLSAQATDKSVNIATRKLFQVADTPEKIIDLGEEGLIPFIKSVGLYKTKAKHIIGLSKKIVCDYAGEVPRTREELMSLPGVGRKTANVVLNVVWGEHTMPVDTHLLRIAPKIGLAEGNTPETVEKSLINRIPDIYMEHAHHWLILHGRYICTARNPKCDKCFLNDLCKLKKEC
ncbi:MAG: endonuclease III [Treponema sp.]|nr:endonuclease III [Treponema sp.]MBQ7881501.1 endonuclease III [Treponema sp.]